jgi:hypothetical protein
MKKTLTLLLFIISLNELTLAQETHYPNSFVLSPGSLFLGRLNMKYEKLKESNFSYGARVEASFLSALDRHIWLMPFGRFYFFNKEHTGLYSEAAIGYRVRYSKTFDPDTFDPNSDEVFKSAPVGRFYLGTQWFSGKKSKTPFDIALGLNIDARNFSKNATETGSGLVTGLVGPLSLINLRIQTGFAW